MARTPRNKVTQEAKGFSDAVDACCREADRFLRGQNYDAVGVCLDGARSWVNRLRSYSNSVEANPRQYRVGPSTIEHLRTLHTQATGLIEEKTGQLESAKRGAA